MWSLWVSVDGSFVPGWWFGVEADGVSVSCEWGGMKGMKKRSTLRYLTISMVGMDVVRRHDGLCLL